jgi:hypothetical protein
MLVAVFQGQVKNGVRVSEVSAICSNPCRKGGTYQRSTGSSQQRYFNDGRGLPILVTKRARERNQHIEGRTIDQKELVLRCRLAKERA